MPNGSLWIGGGELADGPTGSTLYDGEAFAVDSLNHFLTPPQRVVLIDTTSRTVTSSLGPIYSSALVTVQPGEFAPHGALIALLPGRPPSALGWLTEIDPESHAVTDSIRIPMPASPEVETALQIVPSPDGRHIYLTGFDGLYAFDLVTRQLIGAVHFSSYDARLAVSAHGDRVYLLSNPIDVPQIIVGGGGRPVPLPVPPVSPTVIRVFDENLVEQSPIHVHHLLSGKSVLLLRYAAVSNDGKWLYATGSMTTSYADGLLRVFVIELSNGTIAHEIPLELSGEGSIFVGRSQRVQ